VRDSAFAVRNLAVGVIVALGASCMYPGPYPYGPTQPGYGQPGYGQSGYGSAYAGPPGYAGQNQARAGTPYASNPAPVDPYASSSAGSAGMRVVYQPSKSAKREGLRSALQQGKVFDQIAESANRTFLFRQPVTVVFQECGAVNAAWDGESQIVMCYELVEYLNSMFAKRVKTKAELRDAVYSVAMFVFLHELGHGLIKMFDLPSVGREEDAADQLAALTLITAGDYGIVAAMSGAQFFAILASSNQKTPFFDEHSLDSQRFYNVLCMVYGSNPERLGKLVRDDLLPEARAKRCPSEYNKIASSWGTLLANHVQRRR